MNENWISARKNYDFVPQKNILRMHAHDNYEIYCFLTGDAMYSVEGNFYDLKPGDILIMKRAEVHNLIVKSPMPYGRYVVNFSPEAVLGDNKDKIMDFIYNRPLGKHNRFPASVFKEKNWLYYLQKMCDSPFDEQCIYLTVLLNELKNAFPEIQDHEQESDNFSNTIAFINSHITQDIKLEDECNYAFLSKSQLNRKFKTATGSTFWDYVTVKRLILAKELLQNGNHPTRVYTECGFNDYSTFYRAYRTKFNVSPIKDFQPK